MLASTSSTVRRDERHVGYAGNEFGTALLRAAKIAGRARWPPRMASRGWFVTNSSPGRCRVVT